MGVFVIVAAAVLLLSAGAAVVALVALRRSLRGLSAATAEARQRLEPLSEELAAEQAVTALELEALRRRGSAGRAAPARRP